MSKPESSVDHVLDRMVEAMLGEGAHFKSHALALGIPHNTIRTWKRRQKVPLYELESFSERYGVTLDWLLHGDQPEAAPHQVNQNLQPYGLSEDESALLESYRRSSEEMQRAALRMLAESAPKAASGYKPRQRYGAGAQPGKVKFQAGQEKRPLTIGQAEPAGKKTKKDTS